MNDWRKRILLAAGYSSTFGVVFLASLYFTFDLNALRPRIEQAARKNNVELRIQDMDLKGLLGLDLKGVEIAPAGSEANDASQPLKIDRMQVSPRLSTLTGLIASIGFVNEEDRDPGRSGGIKIEKLPKMAFSFDVRMGSGVIEGSYSQEQKSVQVEAKVSDLPLERVPLDARFLKDLVLSGKVNGEIELDMEDTSLPDTWNGRTELDLDNLTASDFEVVGLKVGGLAVRKGTLIADIESGTAKVNPLKLQGDDLNATLIGTVALKTQFTKCILDLKGPVKFSQGYKDKNPLISSFLPSTDNYSYKGTLEGMMAGM